MASRVFSLAAPTPGVWNHVVIPADTAALMFKNDSVYDFLLVFGGTVAPNFLTSPGGQANAFVNALEYPVVYVQKPGASLTEQSLNGVGAFDGNLWYLAQDNTAALATTGTISGRTVLSIMTYGPLDPVPPSGQAVTRQVDLTSQPRIINIPMTPVFAYSNSLTGTALQDAGFFPDIIASLDPTMNTGFVLYLYFAQVVGGATDGAMAFSIRLRFKDGTFAVVGTYDVIFGEVGKSTNIVTPWTFAPAVPFEHRFIFGDGVLPSTTVLVEMDIHDFASPAAWPFGATIMADSDKITPGQVTVPGIGGGLNPQLYAAGIPKF